MSSTIETRTAQLPLVTWIERRSPKQRRFAAVTSAVVALAFIFRIAARVQLDRWWYDSVTDAEVWSTRFWAQVQVGAIAALVAGAALGTSVWLGVRSVDVNDSPASPVVRWYRARFGAGHRWMLIGVSVWLGWHFVAGSVVWWQKWLLFRHGGSVGQAAPELGWDIGYYVFDLPFLSNFLGMVRLVLVAAFAVAIVGHVVTGALRIPIDGKRIAPTARRHLSALIGVLLANEALISILVRRPRLAVNRDGAFDGAGFVQVRLIAPGLWVLAVAAVAATVIVVRSGRRGGGRISVLVVVAYVGLHAVVLFALPALIQRTIVDPAEADRELTYIGHNLEATRAVYGLDRLELSDATVADGLTGPLTDSATDALATLPVYNSGQLVSALQVLQGTTATRISQVDLDRYDVDGTRRPVMVAARNASRADLPESGWVQQHLVYTHGDGVVLVPADVPDADGRPDADALSSLAPGDGALYYGEGLSGWYAIVGTERDEAGGSVYGYDNGIDLGSTWRRLVVASAFGEIEPVLSSELTSESQLLMRRGLVERVKALAPFLALDGDPYPVVVDDRVVWIVDAYTTSATYPYAQFASTAGVPASSGLAGRSFNYLRASVKITVDARDGSIHLYRTDRDRDDLVLDAWETVFPDLLEPASAIPDALRAHLRYPTDAFTVQARLLGRYHVTDAERLFSGVERWDVSRAPANQVGESAAGSARYVMQFVERTDGGAPEWVTVQTYGPGAANNAGSSRDHLSAVLVASNDDPGQLRLTEVEPASSRLLSSPQVAQSAIDADPELAQVFTLLNANGSIVRFGPMTPQLTDGGLVWLRSIVVSGTAATTAPRVHGVVAVSDGLVAEGSDAIDAIARLPGPGS